VLGRYIGRKDEEGRAAQPGLLDFVSQMTPVPNPENTDFPYKLPSLLRWPKFLSINLLAPETKEKYAKEWLDFVKDFVITDEVENYQVLYNEEADQIKRLADYMLTSVPDHEFQYDEFRTYVTEVDGRRNTSFAKTFPELAYLLNKNYYGKTQ
jgi:hypothetical protein